MTSPRLLCGSVFELSPGQPCILRALLGPAFQRSPLKGRAEVPHAERGPAEPFSPILSISLFIFPYSHPSEQ